MRIPFRRRSKVCNNVLGCTSPRIDEPEQASLPQPGRDRVRDRLVGRAVRVFFARPRLRVEERLAEFKILRVGSAHRVTYIIKCLSAYKLTHQIVAL